MSSVFIYYIDIDIDIDIDKGLQTCDLRVFNYKLWYVYVFLKNILLTSALRAMVKEH